MAAKHRRPAKRPSRVPHAGCRSAFGNQRATLLWTDTPIRLPSRLVPTTCAGALARAATPPPSQLRHVSRLPIICMGSSVGPRSLQLILGIIAGTHVSVKGGLVAEMARQRLLGEWLS